MEFKKGMRVRHATKFTLATLVSKMSTADAWKVLFDDGQDTHWWTTNLVLVVTTNEEGTQFLKEGNGL